jgi:hypothetical protein
VAKKSKTPQVQQTSAQTSLVAPRIERRGGARPNSGPKKGTLYRPTIDKQIELAEIRAYIKQYVPQLVESQVKNAIGLKYLVARHKASGKFEKLTEEQAEALMAGGESEYVAVEVWEKDPNVTAFTDLINRLVGKPTEHVEVTGADNGPLQLMWRAPGKH